MKSKTRPPPEYVLMLARLKKKIMYHGRRRRMHLACAGKENQ